MVVELDVFGQQQREVMTAEATAGEDAQFGTGQGAVFVQLLHAFERVVGATRGEQVAATGLAECFEHCFGLLTVIKGPVEGPWVLVGSLRELFEGKLVEAIVGQQRSEYKTIGASALEVADLLLHALYFGVGVHKIASTTANHDKNGLCNLFAQQIKTCYGWGDATVDVMGAIFEPVGRTFAC